MIYSEMGKLFKYTLRFVFFILIQVFILDKIRLHHLVTPYFYFVFILWLPFNINRNLLLFLAFLLGLTLDAFRHHPGFHAASCVLIAYLRPFLMNLMIPQKGAEMNYDEPSFKSMGGKSPYLLYLTLLIFIHNLWLYMLESWQFGNIGYFLLKSFLTTVISLCILLAIELILPRKQKFRTNTV